LLGFVVLHEFVYYPARAYPVLFAAGVVAFQRFGERENYAGLKLAYVVVPLVTGAAAGSYAYFPIGPVECYLAYSRALHFGPPRIENHQMGLLPRIYAYNQPSPEDKQHCEIFGQNYGQAGAVDFFGTRMGLPGASSGHQSYFCWGPCNCTGDCMIVMGDSPNELSTEFDTWVKVATVCHPYSMPYQHFDVYLWRRLRRPLTRVWPEPKNWD
jgi:hypothetical protein